MTRDWVKDINDMHKHYGFHEKVEKLSKEDLQKLLQFRFDFLKEELTEMGDAIEEKKPEDVVDALIDLCVVAIGTLDLFGIDAEKAWDRVHAANMSKEVGIKKSRPNPLGLPDLIKPEGWLAPHHYDNHGTLPYAPLIYNGPGVSPMAAPTGLIFALREKYGNDKDE